MHTTPSLLWTLEEIGQLVSGSGNPSETLTNIVNLIQQRFVTDVCSVYLLEPDRTTLVLAATIGLRPESVGRVKMRINEGLAGLVAEQLRPVVRARRDAAPALQVLPRGGRGSVSHVPRRAGDRSRRAAGRAGRADGRVAGVQRRRSCACCRPPARSWRRSSARRARSGNFVAPVHQRLLALAQNLWWSWDEEAVSLFRELDPVRWRECDHNPIQLLQQMPIAQLEARASQLALHGRINYAYRRLQEYLQSKHTWGGENASVLGARPVAYFSAEFGLHESLPIYSGGLGILAGDHLKSASDLGIPLVGIGLYYDQGYFRQRLDVDGWQHEDYLDVDSAAAADPAGHGARRRAADGGDRDAHRAHPGPGLARQRRPQHAAAARLERRRQQPRGSPADLAPLRRRRAGAHPPGAGARRRRRAGAGGARHLARRRAPERRAQRLCRARADPAAHGEPKASTSPRRSRRVAAQVVFTTHTPVPAGHDRFAPALVEEHLGPLRDALGLSHDEHDGVRPRESARTTDEQFCMTVLALKAVTARQRRVVAARPRLARDVDAALSGPARGPRADRPHHQRRARQHLAGAADAPGLRAAPRRRLGGAQHASRISGEAIENIDDGELWETHQTLKARLIDFTRRRAVQQAERRGEPAAVVAQLRRALSLDALTIGFARRFATYKRANLMLQDLEALAALVNHPQMPVQVIFAGKAHPRDVPGKTVLQQIAALTRDPAFLGKLVFIEDYDINVGRHLVQGVDVWLNNPRRPLEACGTSGQKVVLNGGLNLSVLDGWWAEAYDGRNGFAIGLRRDPHVDRRPRRTRRARRSRRCCATRSCRLYYDRDRDGLPRDWIARMKRAIRTLGGRFSADRMVMDYVLNCYIPAAGGTSCDLSRV